jgi:glycerol-3-phosphate dehydrogenase
VDRILARMGRRRAARRHPTRTKAYPGAPGQLFPAFRAQALEEASREGLPEAAAAHLVETYGARWRDVLHSDERPAAREPVSPGVPWLGCEVTHAVQREQAVHLGDFALRRTALGLGPQGNLPAARAALEWMGDVAGWGRARRDEEWGRYLHEVRQLAVPAPQPERMPAPAEAP